MVLKSLFLTFILAAAPVLLATDPDLDALDRVHVLMPKSRVLELLGKPSGTGTLKGNLRAEIYTYRAHEALEGIACIYGPGDLLKGQALHFRGDLLKACRDHLVACGFQVVEETGGTLRLLGRDDDTGKPLVATLSHEAGLTTVMTFEKAFYDRTVPK